MLFQGKSFYVRRRTPNFDKIVGMIQANGGIIVKIDQQADILITDHTLGSHKENSINCTFISDSVQNGRLESIDNYRVGPNANALQNFECTHPRKNLRLPFSPEDDKKLLEWSLDMESKSKSSKCLKGNKIFQPLEKLNNRHTSQSWRNCLIKICPSRRTHFCAEIDNKNQVKPCINMEKMVESTMKNSSTATEINLRSHKNMLNGNVNDLTSDFISQDRSGYIPKKPIFTESETNQLIDAYSEIIKAPSGKDSEAWKSWAKNSTHTPEEWFNYFHEVIKPMQEALIAENLRMIKRRVITEYTTDQDEAQGSILSIDNTFEKTDSQARSSQLLQPHDLATRNSYESSEDITSISESRLLLDPMVHNEYLFKQGLRDLADELELDVNFTPEICGRKISLMKLWKTVRSPQFGGFREMKGNENWRKLAESFGFIDHNTLAANELKDCYSEILAELEYLRYEFLIEKPLSKRQKKALIENQLLDSSKTFSEDSVDSESMDSVIYETQSICNDSIDLDLPQSPDEPQKSVKKRGINLNSSPNRFTPKKRPRISKWKNRDLEIPSTPESIINFHQNPNIARRNSLECVSTSKKFDQIDALSPSPSNRRSNIRKSVSDKSVSTQVMDLENQNIVFTESSQEASSLPRLKEPTMVEQNEEFQCLRRKKKKEPSATDFLRNKSKNIVDLINNSPPLQEGLISNNGEEKSLCPYISESEFGENSLCPKENKKRFADQIMPLSSQCEDHESQMNEEEKNKLDEFVEIQKKSGFSTETIVKALESTSMIIGPESHIDAALKTIKETGYIPEDLPGVWTTSDDEFLKQAVIPLSSCPSYDNSKALELLIRKHGEINVQHRRDYWECVEFVNKGRVMAIDDASKKFQ